MTANLTDTLRLAAAQLNVVVGDIDGNVKKAREARAKAAAAGADLLVLTELFISGYPPEDLVLKPAFQDACRKAVEALAADTADGGPGIVVGTPWPHEGKCYNAVALLDGGKVEALRYKVELPNYGVFDELRVFEVGPLPGPVGFRGLRLGLPICEDIWFEQVAECLAETGAEMLISPNGSPYWQDKANVRQQVALARVVGPACRSSMSTSAAARTNWSSTAAPSASMATARSPFRCRSSPKASRSPPGRRGRAGGVASTGPRQPCPTSGKPIGRPASWGSATTSTRPVFRASFSASPAASIPPSPRRWPSMRWVRAGSIASCCPIATPPMSASPMPPKSLRRWACVTTSCRSSSRWKASLRRSSPSSPAASRTSPRKISSRGRAAPSSWPSPTSSAPWW